MQVQGRPPARIRDAEVFVQSTDTLVQTQNQEVDLGGSGQGFRVSMVRKIRPRG